MQKSEEWIWGSRQERSFTAAKQALLSSDVLTYYNPNKELLLDCDASPYDIGAVLSHRMENGEIRPVAFASRSLSKVECKYAQLDKEALAIIYGGKKFHQYLYGRVFTIHSDPKPLQHIFDEKRAIPVMASARVQRWALTLSTYQYKIAYKPGSQILHADLLSRLPLPEALRVVPMPAENIFVMEQFQYGPITAKQIKTWRARDPILAKVADMVLSGWWDTQLDDFLPFEGRREEFISGGRLCSMGK